MRVTKVLTGRQFVEFDYVKSKGSSNEYFSSGSTINLEGNDILTNTSANIDIAYSLASGSVHWGLKTLRSEWLKLNVYTGLRYTNLEMDLNGNNVSYHLNNSSYGPTGSFEAIVPIIDSLHGTYRISVSYLSVENHAISLRNQITLNYCPFSWVDIFAGWYVWDYQNSEHRSNINIDMQGPEFGIKILF